MSYTAKDIVALYDAEVADARNFLTLYQETSDYCYPLENQITTRHSNGQPLTVDLVDTTAVFDLQDMASGLSSTMIPPGQPLYDLGSTDRRATDDEGNKRWLSYATDKSHEAIWDSNFLMQFDEFLKSLTTFGEGCVFSEFIDGGLNYMEYPAGTFHYQENHKRLADVFLEKFEFTARQAIAKFGRQAVSDDIRKAADDPKRSTDRFEFVHACLPRKERDTQTMDSLNMAYADYYVSCQDNSIVYESGFEEFPFHIGRWSKSAMETRGRGVGTYLLPQVRGLNAMKRDLIECGNRHNNPPREIGPGLEGALDVSPGANNYVTTMGQIRALDTLTGNFPITVELIAGERQEVHRACLIDVFNQLMNLRGDRRTTLEISERLREGLRRLAQPIGRLISEVLDPLIMRSVLLLVQNEVLPPPPIGLQGKGMKVTYQSFLVLMLKQYQAQAFSRWLNFVAMAEQVFPGVKDNVDADEAVRDMADAFGVKAEHKRSIRSRDALRQQRAEELARQQQQQQMAEAAQSYKQTTRAPEDGSLAGEVLNANAE